MRTKALFLLALGMILGLAVSLIGMQTKIEFNDLIRYYFIGAVVFLFLFIVIHLVRITYFQNKLRQVIPILYIEKDTKRFIHEMIPLVNKAPSIIRSILEVTLATGYSADGNDERAYQILTSVDPRNLSEENQAGYYINLFAITYNLGNERNAVTILDTHDELLTRFENHPALCAGLAVNNVFRYITEHNYENAKLHLKKAESHCTDPYLQDVIEYLNAVILIYENKVDQAQRLLEQLKDRQITPSLHNKIRGLESTLCIT